MSFINKIYIFVIAAIPSSAQTRNPSFSKPNQSATKSCQFLFLSIYHIHHFQSLSFSLLCTLLLQEYPQGIASLLSLLCANKLNDSQWKSFTTLSFQKLPTSQPSLPFQPKDNRKLRKKMKEVTSWEFVAGSGKEAKFPRWDEEKSACLYLVSCCFTFSVFFPSLSTYWSLKWFQSLLVASEWASALLCLLIHNISHCSARGWFRSQSARFDLEAFLLLLLKNSWFCNKCYFAFAYQAILWMGCFRVISLFL